MKRIGLGTAMAALLAVGASQQASATVYLALDLDPSTAGIQTAETFLGPLAGLTANVVAWSDVEGPQAGISGDSVDTISLAVTTDELVPAAATATLPDPGEFGAGAFIGGGAIIGGAEGVTDVTTDSVVVVGFTGTLTRPTSVGIFDDPTLLADGDFDILLSFTYNVQANPGTSTLRIIPDPLGAIGTIIGGSPLGFLGGELTPFTLFTSDVTLQAQPAPAPASLALLAAGLLAFGVRSRRTA